MQLLTECCLCHYLCVHYNAVLHAINFILFAFALHFIVYLVICTLQLVVLG